jgi:hypothetical protein
MENKEITDRVTEFFDLFTRWRTFQKTIDSLDEPLMSREMWSVLIKEADDFEVEIRTFLVDSSNMNFPLNVLVDEQNMRPWDDSVFCVPTVSIDGQWMATWKDCLLRQDEIFSETRGMFKTLYMKYSGRWPPFNE